MLVRLRHDTRAIASVERIDDPVLRAHDIARHECEVEHEERSEQAQQSARLHRHEF
jgi:hypothetical protein